MRGIAMNPVDHPHGGGRKSKGGKAARSPWGWLTKGPKTVKNKKWFVVVPRWKVNCFCLNLIVYFRIGQELIVFLLN